MAVVLYASGSEYATIGNTFSVSGTATDPTTVSVVVTDPTGASTTYTYAGGTVTRTAAGVYTLDVACPTAGRWVAVWTGTGTASDVAEVAWHVESLAPIVALTEIKNWLRVTATDDDSELEFLALVASDICEDRTGQVWRRRTITAETYDTDGRSEAIQLRSRPVESVTAVTVSGSAVTDWLLDGRRGLLYRGSATGLAVWPYGVQNTAVTYVAAPTAGVVPANIRQGYRVLLQHLWETQRGGAIGGSRTQIDPRTGFTVPLRVLQLWGSAPGAGPMVG